MRLARNSSQLNSHSGTHPQGQRDHYRNTPVAHSWGHICREVVQEMTINQTAKSPLHLSIYDSEEVTQSLKGDFPHL